MTNLSTTRTSFVVEGLAPSTTYLIAVKSVNKLGWSQSMDTLVVVTLGELGHLAGINGGTLVRAPVRLKA